MGYSGRYHAASLAAVFLALAVGILIGVGFGSDVVTGTAESLEEDLGSDLTEARERVSDLEGDLERERDLSRRLFPAVVGDRLANEEVAIVAIGSLPEDVASAVDDAIDPAGADLAEIAVIALPTDPQAVIDELTGPGVRQLSRGEALELASRRAGRALATGGPLFDEVRRSFLTRYSGTPTLVRGTVLFRQVPEDLGPRQADNVERLETGLVEGLESAGVTVVGIERSDEESSSVEAFDAHGISSVDNIDGLAGRVALVFALDGTEGRFGVKETADSLLPELLPPAARRTP
jgi:hypothetical protein